MQITKMGRGVGIPGVRRGAKGDSVICASAGECAGGIVVCVAVSLWAGFLEQLRVRRGGALVRSRVRAAAAVLWFPERLARALARDVLCPVGAGNLQLGGADAIQVHLAAGFVTVPAGASMRHHHHRKVIPIDQADVVVVEAAVAVGFELGEGGRRNSASSAF